MATPHLIVLLVLMSTLCVLTKGSGPSLSGPDQNYIIKLHNDARDLETAQDMHHATWDSSLAAEAQAWTDACQFAHGKGKPWGENLSAAGYSSGTATTASLDRLFNLWMSEKKYNTEGTFEECCSQKNYKCCHYTQVIWAKSTEIGCGLTLCPSLIASWGTMKNMLYLACFYTPRGNKPAVSYTYDWRPYLPVAE